ncbi:hypothetical protein FIV37_19320 [Pseudomonas gessardii]|nr:hypothetical protein [Pseudomonas gessardii]
MREVQRTLLHRRLIVPTLRVVTPPVTLRVTWLRDAERPRLHSHAERGNDQKKCPGLWTGAFLIERQA